MEFLFFQAACVIILLAIIVTLSMCISECGLCIIKRRCQPSPFICIVLAGSIIALFLIVSEYLYNSNKIIVSVNKYPVISNGIEIGRRSPYIVYDYNGEVVSRSISGDGVKYTNDKPYIEIISSKAGIFKKKFDDVIIYLNKGE